MFQQYSKWVCEVDGPLIIEFEMLLPSVPPWILVYLTRNASFPHRIAVLMKIKGSQFEYENFTGTILETLTKMQCSSLEKVLFHFFPILFDSPFSIFQHP